MAELSVTNPELMTIAELKEWLSSKGAPIKGKKSELVERVHAFLKYGWTKAGKEISTMEKQDAVKYPESGWVPLVSAFSQWEPSSLNEPRFSMASIMAYFISRITEDSLPAGDFKSSSRLAENLFRCGHVQSIEVAIIPELSNCLFVRSKCLPEMRKDRVYIVCMHLNRTKFDIINAECGCPAGKGPFGSCKHIGALAYALADFFRLKSEPHLTCTDQLQKWNQPRNRKVDPKPVDQLGERRRELLPSKVRSKGSQMVYDPRPTHFRESNTAEAIENLRCSLLRIGKPCAFLNVFIPSKAKIALDHNYSQSKVLHDHDYCHSNQTSWQQYSPQEDTNDEISSLLGEDDQLTAEDVLEALSVNKEQQEELESKTRSQSNSLVWFTERRRRITGSKCGRIIAQKEHTVSLLRSVIYQKPIIQLPNSLKWGKENEDNACAEYVRYMNGHGHCGLHTQKAGFVVDTEKCWLGASPDAWVVDPSSENSNGIAEFKCPYVMANKTPEEMCQNKLFFCEIVNGKIHLKNNHSYYHQVQLQLYVTRSKAKWCDFCVYSTKGISVQRIFPDNDWQETSCLKLDDYFLNHILPELVYPQFKPSYFL